MRKKSAIIILDACRYDHITKDFSPNIYSLAQESEIYPNTYAISTESSTSMPKFFSGDEKKGKIGFDYSSPIGKLSLFLGKIFPPKIRKKFIFFKPLVSNKRQDLDFSLLE